MLDTTSTCTVLLDDGGVPRFRTYGIFGPTLTTASANTPEARPDWWADDPTDATGPCTGQVAEPCPQRPIPFLDSGRVDPDAVDCTATYTAYDPRLVAVVDDPAVGVCGAQPLTGTCIPSFKRHCLDTDEEWPYEYIDHLITDFPENLYANATINNGSARLAVIYKDPSVVRLTDGEGGWLMLLKRIRVLEPTIIEDTGDCPTCDEGLPSEQDDCLGDLVAWWSSDPSFDDGKGVVRGPFLIVDSLQALPGLTLRFWLGVPGGVIADGGGGDALYVYYAITPPFAQGETDETATAYLDPGLSLGAWTSAIHAYMFSGLATQYFRQGLAVKRIALADLRSFIGDATNAGAGETDERLWTSSSAVPGDLLGQVRIWCCDTTKDGAHPEVSAFQTYFEHTDSTTGVVTSPTPADPAAILSTLGLNLYFSAIKGAEGDTFESGYGYGIWRAVAMPAWEETQPGLVETRRVSETVEEIFITHPVFGVDFVACVAINPETGLPRDQVEETPDADHHLIDPDPSQDPITSEWRVYVGGGPDMALTLYLGEENDGNTAWYQAWCVFADAQEAAADESAAQDAHGARELDPVATIERALPWLRRQAHADDPYSPRGIERAMRSGCGCACPQCG